MQGLYVYQQSVKFGCLGSINNKFLDIYEGQNKGATLVELEDEDLRISQ